MTGGKFYPQHKDKCYCRLSPSACLNSFVRSDDFVKTKSVRYRRPKSPQYQGQHNDNFEKITCHCCKTPLNYSNQRSNYELNQRPWYERLELQNHNDGDLAGVYSPKSINNQPSRCSSARGDNQNMLKKYTHDKLNKLGEFRSNNSNDCISITNRLSLERKRRELLKEAESHVCTHRYKLNERRMPVPLNRDANGSSTCVNCSKSLCDSNPLAHVKNRIITADQYAAISSVSNAGQEPILILEVQMDKNEIVRNKLKVTTAPLARKTSVPGINPKNSCALRFQNMKG